MPTGLFGVRSRTTISRGGTEAASVSRARTKLGLAIGSDVQIQEAKGADIASAATTDLSTLTGNFADVTGTDTITSFGTVAAGTKVTLQYDGILILTHHATSLILPGGANITTAAGDVATFISLGSGNWLCTNYMRAAGTEITILDTEQAATSTPLDFTAPFATVTRAVVIFEGVSLSTTNDVTVQIGPTAGLETTGYVSTSTFLAGGGGAGGDEVLNTSSTAGFILQNDNAGHSLSGTMDLILSNSSNNTWVSSHTGKQGGTATVVGGGNKDLAGALTDLRVAGTTFDGGAVNVRWYGLAI